MKIHKQLQRLSKITALALIVLLNGVGLAQVGSTVGFYVDVETSSANAFTAGNVDFTATSTPWNHETVAVSMQPGDTASFDIAIDPLTSNSFQYSLQADTTGDSAFCSGISTTLEQDAETLYSGALDALLTGTTTSTSTLSLSAGTGVHNFQNSVCSASLDATGWQTRHGYPTVGGFNDTEMIEKEIASWGFRFNKVYYDVAPERFAEGTTTEGENEWVEIYNQTNVPLDLSGWEVCDNTSCDILASSTPRVVPAMGYAVITNDPGTFSATGTAPWYLPASVVHIPLGENIGNGLSNSADMLVLKRPDGVVIDQMNWGTPNTSWANYNANVWNPGAVDVAEGNLLVRVPHGFDTNSPSDWVEIAPPAVDLVYPDEGGSYTWYWGYSYTITWTATNPNGNDDDLNISLFYIKDVDHTGTITGVDTTHTIANTTANDGAYTWTAPSGFIGYIWIKLVATGPENPLNNSRTISGLIYDPIPLFVGPVGSDESDLDDVDTEAPVITLFGNNPSAIAQSSTYADLGASVTDNVNQNLGYTAEGAVDTAVVGEYTITYTAVDQAGNVGTAERTIVVYDPDVGPPVFEPAETPPEDVTSSGSESGGSTGTEAAPVPEETDNDGSVEDEEVAGENSEEGGVSTEEAVEPNEDNTENAADETILEQNEDPEESTVTDDEEEVAGGGEEGTQEESGTGEESGDSDESAHGSAVNTSESSVEEVETTDAVSESAEGGNGESAQSEESATAEEDSLSEESESPASEDDAGNALPDGGDARPPQEEEEPPAPVLEEAEVGTEIPDTEVESVEPEPEENPTGESEESETDTSSEETNEAHE